MRVYNSALGPTEVSSVYYATQPSFRPTSTATSSGTPTKTGSGSPTASGTRSGTATGSGTGTGTKTGSGATTATPSQTRAGSATETFAPPNCKQEAWRILTNTDIDGVDIAVNTGVYSARECQLSCCTYFNPPCTSYAYDKYVAVCILKTNSTIMAYSSAFDSGLLASVYT